VTTLRRLFGNAALIASSKLSSSLDSCAIAFAGSVLLVALLTLGFGGYQGVSESKVVSLRVSTPPISLTSENPDSLASQKHQGIQRIIPEARNSWIRVDGIVGQEGGSEVVIIFPGLQLRDGRFWLYSESDSGEYQRISSVPILFEKGSLGATVSFSSQIGVVKYFGIADITPKMPRIVVAQQSSPDPLSRQILSFERYGGALTGMFFSLAAFAFVVGVINRETTFLLFAGWLVTSYRLAAVNAGYDLEWIAGIDPSAPLGQLALRGSFAIHGFLTMSLFKRLFIGGINKHLWTSITTLQVAFLGLIAIAGIVPHTKFFQISWIVAAIALVLQVAGLINTLRGSRRIDLRLPALAWTVNVAGSLLQIASTSGYLSKSIPLLNSQSAAFASGFLIALALADRMRTERQARIEAQNRAVSALTKFRETFTSVPIGLFTLDAEGNFVQYNPAFAEMFTLLRDSGADQKLWSDFFDLTHLQELKDSLLKRGKAEIELLDRSKGRWFRIHAYGTGSQIEGSIEDITSRRQVRERLQRLADHDSLTDLLNRRGLDLCLVKQITEVTLNTPSCLAFMDMDRFKLVNDMFGHASGDSVLVEIANRLRTASPNDAELARVGGDEFVLLFKNCPSAEAKSICARIVSEVNERPFSVGEKQFSVVASIGLIALTGTMTPSFAVSAADRACADAKRQGGNRVVVYGETDRELQNHVAEMDMVSKIHSSLPVDRMRMVLQPIVSLQAPFASLSYESLLRVIDDDGRLGPPAALIQAAERHGFISRLDRWVLNTMVDWLNAHPEHREHLNYCAINLSGASLNDERFLADVLAIVRANPEAAKRMCFEITETVALYDLKNTCRFVDAVRGFGSKVALDDFGAGYTSFNYLKSLQADLVKIDGTFVKTLDTDRSNYAITRTIVDLTHEMGMSCVAEWAENARVVEMLAQMGVDYGQGWALAKPLPMDSLLAVWNSGELVTDLEVINILQKDREPVFRLPTRHILAGDSVRDKSVR
jgi:diguanylate cyclase (GGDEF)-like protein/PAS domain S-box-containing protein